MVVSLLLPFFHDLLPDLFLSACLQVVPAARQAMASFDPRLLETVTAPTNIAVIKYWGKDSVDLNTPINSSVSCTLEQVRC